MALICVILDCEPKYLRGGRPAQSLLMMPLGRGTILSELADAVREVGCTDLRVLPTFKHDSTYLREITRQDRMGFHSPVVKSAGREVMTALVREYEPSDHVLIVDPRHWPAGGLELDSLLREAYDTRWALHGVAVASTPEGTREFVHCDDRGQVTRIFRYYEDVTCSGIRAIVQSLVPLAPSVEGLRFDSLAELRAALAQRGMLSRDVPLRFGRVDLAEEKGLLALNEQYVVGTVGSEAVPHRVTGHSSVRAYTPLRHGILVGQRCRIHPSARLIPPVVIQDEVTIEAGATVIGPSVLGSGCQVRQGALVAQSVLALGTTVSHGAVVRHRAAHGKCRGDAPSVNDDGDPAVPRAEAVGSQLVRLGADASVMRHARRPGRSLYPAIKLAVDVLVAAVSLVLLAPLFLIVAIAVKLESKGPVFFSHDREGKGGRVFRCLKFRTMCQDAHLAQRSLYAANALDGPQFKLDNDPRVTRVGQWLRATNIDELPQLINVFLGQMSIVGPRPSPFRENQICVPWRRARLSVRPGITGLWQICRDQRSEGDFHQWITYDIMYVRNLSFWLDQKILLATVLTLGGMWTVPHTWLVRADHSGAPDTPVAYHNAAIDSPDRSTRRLRRAAPAA